MHRNLLTGPSLPFLYYAAGRERKEDGGGPLSLRGKSEMAVPPEYILYVLYVHNAISRRKSGDTS